MVDPVPDYCPFCGARLADDGLDDHLAERDECRGRYEAWRPESGSSSVGRPRVRGGFARVALQTVLVLAILAYSLLISQQLLLGVVAAAIVVLVFQFL